MDDKKENKMDHSRKTEETDVPEEEESIEEECEGEGEDEPDDPILNSKKDNVGSNNIIEEEEEDENVFPKTKLPRYIPFNPELLPKGDDLPPEFRNKMPRGKVTPEMVQLKIQEVYHLHHYYYLEYQRSIALKQQQDELRHLRQNLQAIHDKMVALDQREGRKILWYKMKSLELDKECKEKLKENAHLMGKLAFVRRRIRKLEKRYLRERTDDMLYANGVDNGVFKPNSSYFHPSTELHTSGGVLGSRKRRSKERRYSASGGITTKEREEEKLFQNKLGETIEKEKVFLMLQRCDCFLEDCGRIKQDLFFMRRIVDRWYRNGMRLIKSAFWKIKVMIESGMMDIHAHYDDEHQMKIQMEVFRDFGLVFEDDPIRPGMDTGGGFNNYQTYSPQPQQQQQRKQRQQEEEERKKKSNKWGFLGKFLKKNFCSKKNLHHTIPAHPNRRPLDGRPWVQSMMECQNLNSEDIFIFPKHECYIDIRLVKLGKPIGGSNFSEKALWKKFPPNKYSRYYGFCGYKGGTITLLDSKEATYEKDVNTVNRKLIRHTMIMQGVEFKSDVDNTKVRVEMMDYDRVYMFRFEDMYEKDLFLEFWKNLFSIYRGDDVYSSREEDEEKEAEEKRRDEQRRKIRIGLRSYQGKQMKIFDLHIENMMKLEKEFGDCYSSDDSDYEEDMMALNERKKIFKERMEKLEKGMRIDKLKFKCKENEIHVRIKDGEEEEEEDVLPWLEEGKKEEAKKKKKKKEEEEARKKKKKKEEEANNDDSWMDEDDDKKKKKKKKKGARQGKNKRGGGGRRRGRRHGKRKRRRQKYVRRKKILEKKQQQKKKLEESEEEVVGGRK